MNSYLRSITAIADFLAAIQSPISDLELIQLTTVGLPKDYDSFVTTFSMLPGLTTFDKLCSKLLFYEQHLHYKENRYSAIHEAFVASTRESQGHRHTKGASNSKGNCNNQNKGGPGRNNNNKNKNNKSSSSTS